MQKSENLSVLFISHDLSVVREIADKIIIMKSGEIIEQGSNYTLFNNPKTSYTKALLSVKPSKTIRVKELPTIEKILNKNFKNDIINTQTRSKKLNKIYSKPPLLKISNINKHYISKLGLFTKQDRFKALKKINLDVEKLH